MLRKILFTIVVRNAVVKQQPSFFKRTAVMSDVTFVFASPIFRRTVEDRVQEYMNCHLRTQVEVAVQRQMSSAVNNWFSNHANTQAVLLQAQSDIRREANIVMKEIVDKNWAENPVFNTFMSRVRIQNDMSLEEYKQKVSVSLREDIRNLERQNSLLGIGLGVSFCLSFAALIMNNNPK